MNAVSRRVAEAHGTGFVDLDAVVPKDLDHLYDDVHMTPRGCEIAADALTDELLRRKAVWK